MLPKWTPLFVALAMSPPHDERFTDLKKNEMNLFAGLRRMRELERKHLPFVRSLAEIGRASCRERVCLAV